MEAPKKQSEPKAAAKPVAKAAGGGKLAVVRIRGTVGLRPGIRRTLTLLKLLNKNACVILPGTPSVVGMLQVAKDYVTWGHIDDDTHKLLVDKRGKPDIKDPKKVSNLFHLSPPRGGYGRKGIKKPFSVGGALGDRGAKINDLLKRMI